MEVSVEILMTVRNEVRRSQVSVVRAVSLAPVEWYSVACDGHEVADVDVLVEFTDGSSVRFGVAEGSPVVPQLAWMLDALQADIGEFGQMLVNCDGHSHWPNVVIVGDSLVWVCPTTGAVVREVVAS